MPDLKSLAERTLELLMLAPFSKEALLKTEPTLKLLQMAHNHHQILSCSASSQGVLKVQPTQTRYTIALLGCFRKRVHAGL